MDEGLSHRFIEVSDGNRLHCVEAGQNGGKRPLVILLHGFPEFWWGWRHQIRPLAAAGYHVVAADMRGYNLSDKPRGVDPYRIDRLAQDVADLVKAHGAEKAIIVGHDWGGVVAWEVAMHHPDIVDRMAILNAPHPVTMRAAFKTADQLKKSWYIFAFQLPVLPERWYSAKNWLALRKSMGRAMGGEVERYIEALSRPNALTSAINYYRASIRALVKRTLRKPRPIGAPVLVIWGERDRFLGRDLARPSPKLVPDARVEYVAEGSHWVQHDAPEKVTALLLEFFRQPAMSSRFSIHAAK
jgi:pimeloyl-ACP methyl ester carboxylesterase